MIPDSSRRSGVEKPEVKPWGGKVRRLFPVLSLATNSDSLSLSLSQAVEDILISTSHPRGEDEGDCGDRKMRKLRENVKMRRKKERKKERHGCSCMGD